MKKDEGVYSVTLVFYRIKDKIFESKVFNGLILAENEVDSFSELSNNYESEITKLAISGYSICSKSAFKVRTKDITFLWECMDEPEPNEEKYTEFELRQSKSNNLDEVISDIRKKLVFIHNANEKDNDKTYVKIRDGITDISFLLSKVSSEIPLQSE